jgi:hypothetical protein
MVILSSSRRILIGKGMFRKGAGMTTPIRISWTSKTGRKQQYIKNNAEISTV